MTAARPLDPTFRARAVGTARTARGVYFLANDRVLELAIAFLNSFRAHNPELPLCLVPFDQNVDRIVRLRDEYQFSVYEDERALATCDAISRRFHGRVVGHYRKLAMWEATFDEFVYIDVDTVVLDSVDFVFGFLTSFDFIVSSSHSPHLEKWVWRRSMRRSGLLDEEQIRYSANTGFVASRKGSLFLATAEMAAAHSDRLAGHFNLACQEQPFLNYLIVTSGGRYTSLAYLARSGSPHRIKIEHWAGRPGAVVEGGRVSPLPGRPGVLLVHWAGQWLPRRWERMVRGARRALGLRPVEDDGGPMRAHLPYRGLWDHYRRLRDGQT